jgi:hypothetical protein
MGPVHSFPFCGHDKSSAIVGRAYTAALVNVPVHPNNREEDDSFLATGAGSRQEGRGGAN